MLVGAAVAAVVVTGSPTEAVAQEGKSFGYAEPFPGTVREQLLDNQARTGAQLYGAVGMLEREILPEVDRYGASAISGFTMMMGGVRVPGYCAVCGDVGDSRSEYRLLPADTYAWSVGAGFQREYIGAFAVASATYTRVADSTETFAARAGWPLAGMMGLPFSHVALLAAPFATGPIRSGDDGLAQMVSYVAGVSFAYAGQSLRLGMIGSSRGAGLYTNLTQTRLRAFLSAALMDEFKDVPLFKLGFDHVPDSVWSNLDKVFEDDAAERRERDRRSDKLEGGTTSFYGRRVQFLIPRPGAADVTHDFGSLPFWSTHVERTGLAKGIVDVGVAAGLKPSLMLHEARISLHNKEYHTTGTGVMLSLGAVQLPALYMLAQQPGMHLAFRAEVKIKHVVRFATYRNEPEILTAFPYAYDAWTVSLLVNPLLMLAGMMK